MRNTVTGPKFTTAARLVPGAHVQWHSGHVVRVASVERPREGWRDVMFTRDGRSHTERVRATRLYRVAVELGCCATV